MIYAERRYITPICNCKDEWKGATDMNKKIKRIPSWLCYFKGWRDSRKGRVIKDDNGELTSHFLISCSKTVNAYASSRWFVNMKKIFDYEAQIKQYEQSIVQIRFRTETRREGSNINIQRNDRRITRMEMEITRLKTEKEKVIRETFEEIFEAKYVIESVEIEPYLRAASKRIPSIRYTVELEDMPYAYTDYSNEDIGDFENIKKDADSFDALSNGSEEVINYV